MANLWQSFKDWLAGVEHEPEGTEYVEHDIVILGGRELTADDSEEGQ